MYLFNNACCLTIHILNILAACGYKREHHAYQPIYELSRLSSRRSYPSSFHARQISQYDKTSKSELAKGTNRVANCYCFAGCKLLLYLCFSESGRQENWIAYLNQKEWYSRPTVLACSLVLLLPSPFLCPLVDACVQYQIKISTTKWKCNISTLRFFTEVYHHNLGPTNLSKHVHSTYNVFIIENIQEKLPNREATWD